MAFLPVLLFRDRHALPAILVAWALAWAGSIPLSYLMTWLVPEGAGPDFGDAPPAMRFAAIALLSPVIETIIMAAFLALLLRWLKPWQAVIASAVLWGVAHSALTPLWGLVIWWPFLIFSTVFVTWRPRGMLRAFAMAALVHVLQNGLPAVMIASG